MRTAVIVGASRGLGQTLALEHWRRGWRVIGTVRDDSPVGDDIEVLHLDVTDKVEVDGFDERLPHPIDRLFVVAGVAGPMDPIGDVPADVFASTLITNVVGPLWTVDRLADVVTDRGTIAVMSSLQGSVTENERGDQETYRISKAGLNMGLRSLAARRGDHRTYLAVDPGYVRTDMTGDDAPLTIEESVPMIVDMLDARSGTGGMAFVDRFDHAVPW